MSGAKSAEEVGYIETVRRVSGIQLTSKADHKDAADEQLYIEAIRRVSGVQLSGDGKDIIKARREVSAAKIQAERGMSSAEIGVIEGVRRLSGINAALLEMGEPVNKPKPVQIEITVDGKLKAPAAYDKVPPAGPVDNHGLGDKEWHIFSEKELLEELSTSVQGLNAFEAEKRLEQYGLNEITPPPTTHWLVKFGLILIGGFQLMMWFGAVLCFVVYGLSGDTDVQTLALAIVLIIVVLATSIFQSYQVSSLHFPSVILN